MSATAALRDDTPAPAARGAPPPPADAPTTGSADGLLVSEEV